MGSFAVILLVLVVAVVVTSLALVEKTAAEGEALVRLKEAQRETAKARAFAETLRRLIRSASPDVARGRDISVLRQMLASAERDADTSLADLPEVRSDLRQTIGETYCDLGLYDDAERLLRAALRERRTLFGEDDPAVAESLFGLAGVHYDRSEYEPALAGFRRALAIQQASLSPEDPRLASTMERLARTLADSGDHHHRMEADALCRDLLTRKRRLHPEDSIEVASTLSILGDIQCDAGRLEEAERTFRNATEIQRGRLGDSTALASTLVGLGRVLLLAGKTEEAESVLRDVLDLRVRLLGERHPALAWPSSLLARLLSEQGRHAEAEVLCRAVVEVQIAGYGEDDLEVAGGLEQLADVLVAQGGRAEARKLYREVIRRRRRDFGRTDSVARECEEKLDAIE